MPKPRLEDTLELLNSLRGAALTDASQAILKKALTDASPHVVAKAAQIASELQALDLWQDIAGAFPRFMRDPLKSDKGCRAKTQIAQTLYDLGAPADTVFLQGIRHTQMEPVYGGREDSASLLRGACALGLVRMAHPDAMIELADLLADKTPQARTLAARAIGYSQVPAGVPLLRYKAQIGDADSTVTAECLAALLKSQGARALPFVETFLHGHDDHVAELTALSLGESRLPGAFDALLNYFNKTLDTHSRRTAMIAIATLRQDQATDFLITQIKESPDSLATHAISALSIFRHDPNIKARILAAAGSRAKTTLKQALAEAFDN
jgi:HEAT repeat protein